MSNLNSSLALEETKETTFKCEVQLPVRHLSIRNASTPPQLACQVVKVSGSVTVSF